MKKTTAFLLLVLLCTCGVALAQSDSSKKCTDSDKKAAKELAQSFFENFRRDYDLAAIRDEFVSSTARCGSLFSPDPVEIATALREQLGCAHIQHLEDSTFDFILLISEYQMGAEKGFLDDTELQDAIPPDVIAAIKDNPFWAKIYQNGDSGTGREKPTENWTAGQKVRTSEDFYIALRGIDEMNTVMRHYFETHPDHRQRALVRLQQHDAKSESTGSRTDCTVSDGEPFYHAPEGTAVMFTDLFPLPFQVMVIRENGQLRISSVVLAD